ncbi:permease prefix domain 1-containing protein [Occultella kanbiaonis]|uniref:permease prefix domain 1-containing protein n=1 Tax=Occultella kanbiaonis TaxID=2675754 RepID=UPI0013CF69C5|nr:permease prefix domain 1-containing protein [Occultella kanbiaonis]
MDTITTYIDHMFRSLPPTAEVARARSELLQMGEDRYRELLAEGVSENEAVGRVITQFGNLDELADDLGIRGELDRAGGEDAPVEFSRDEAERFLDVRRRGAWFISSGVFVILLGISQLVFLTEGPVDGAGVDRAAQTVPLALLFVSIAGAVALFIVGGVSLSRYDRLEHKELRLEPQVAMKYRTQREREQGTFVALLAGGVSLIILAVAIPAIFAESASGAVGRAVAVMLVIIAIGVGILIQAGMRRGALDRLTAEGDYAPEKRRSNSITGRVAGPYWMLAVAIFLGWSFIGDAWEKSWIIWPIAGILFAAFVVTIESFSPDKRKVDGVR